MNIKATIIFPALLAMCTCLYGQVLPPIIDCITNDTIFFTPVSNNCGPFLSYDVFRSSDADGPYNLVGNITDPNALFLADPNSSSTINYYYITPNFDCPGEIVINSDTITNRPPEVNDISTISVINNELNIAWESSSSPEVVEYNLFLVTDAGLELLITTPDLSYVDTARDPSIASYSYLIVAIDVCGNRSIFSDQVSSIHLNITVSGDNCDGSVGFAWNRHVNTLSQELWAIDINGNEVLIEALAASDESFLIEEFTVPGINSLFIRAYLNSDRSLVVDSNIRNVSSISVSIPIEEILFTNLSTFNDNLIEATWCWNNDADLSTVGLEYSFSNTTEIKGVNFAVPLQSNQSETIALLDGGTDTYTLQVQTIDVCDLVFDSAPINTILLEVNPISESEVEVSWSPYTYSDASLESYQLFRVVNGAEELVYEGSANKQILSSAEIAGEQCYYIIAQASGTLDDGTEKAVQVISNLDCTSGFPIIRMPNAFNPYGVNSIFRPLIGNADAIASYQMKIFSRWGELLFSTTDTARGWNGRDGLRELPQGVYSYIVEVEVVGGEEINMLGSVLLIR
jgi:gliding motility-associated-like protein